MSPLSMDTVLCGHPKFMECSKHFARARKSSTEMLLGAPQVPNAKVRMVGVGGGTGQVQEMMLGWSLLYPSLLKDAGKWDQWPWGTVGVGTAAGGCCTHSGSAFQQ